MDDYVISVDPTGENSRIADEKNYQLYASAKDKNGKMVAFNELKSFSSNLEHERQEALEEFKENEKWFKKGIEFLNKWKNPYKVGEASEADKERIEELYKTYPDLSVQDHWEDHKIMTAHKLSTMVHYIEANSDFFEKVDFNIPNTVSELKTSLFHLDLMHVMYERSKDLIQVIVKTGFEGNIDKKSFIRSKEEIIKAKKNTPGPSTPEGLREDIQEIIREVKGKSEFMYRGSLNKSKTLEYAIDNQMFYKRWVDERSEFKKGGYSERHLKNIISEENEKMKS